MGQNHQNSWDSWMFIPLKMVFIGIDPWPYVYILCVFCFDVNARLAK